MGRRTRLSLFAIISLGALVGAFFLPGPASARAATPAPQRSLIVQAFPASPPPPASWTVRSGDTLSGIGVQVQRSWPQLAGWNRLADPNLIYPGQVLKIPPASYAAPATVPPVAVPSASSTPRSQPQRSVPATGSGGTTEASATISSGGWSGPWACIAKYESGGNPATDTGNGFYGGLQFTLSTWHAEGGVGNPADASIAEQEAVANRVLAVQGWGAWPNTSRMCGY